MNVSQILPNLYVGSCPITPRDIDELKDAFGVTAVVSLQTDDDLRFWNIDWNQLETHYRQSGLEVRRTPVRDFDAANLRQNLPACAEQLDALLRAGHTVYVHCSAGINRSPSTVIAYLHWMQQWPLRKAVDLVRSRRDCDPYVEAIVQATHDRGTSASDHDGTL
jgi:atypical dual specificity phosphatase